MPASLTRIVCRLDLELPTKMASLDLMAVDSVVAPSTSDESPGATQVRVLRKRKSPPIVDIEERSTNRRVTMKPRKRLATEMASPKEIEALYLNKKVKTSPQTLETIFEEPKSKNSEPVTLIGGRKMKRHLTFQIGNQFTKEKIKKRRAKIKKLLGNKTFLNRKKIPMTVFLKTIECLELDETISITATKDPDNALKTE